MSDNGTVPTTFVFDSPIFLQQGNEYCIVLRTPSLNYRPWISQLGEVDVSGTNRVVSTQPTLGSLFKSQNNTAWTPVQSEDMKVKLHKLPRFTSLTGTVTLVNDNIGEQSFTAEDGSTTVYGRRLVNNPLTLSNSSTAMRVKHLDHGMYSTSNNVKITGAKSGIETTLNGAITTATATSLTLTSNTGFEVLSNDSSRCYVKIDNEIMFARYLVVILIVYQEDKMQQQQSAHSNGATVELYQILKTPLTEINKTHTAISAIDMNSYAVTLTTAPTIAGASTTAEVGKSTVYASENYRLETLRTQISTLELNRTSVPDL